MVLVLAVTVALYKYSPPPYRNLNFGIIAVILITIGAGGVPSLLSVGGDDGLRAEFQELQVRVEELQRENQTFSVRFAEMGAHPERMSAMANAALELGIRDPEILARLHPAFQNLEWFAVVSISEGSDSALGSSSGALKLLSDANPAFERAIVLGGIAIVGQYSESVLAQVACAELLASLKADTAEQVRCQALPTNLVYSLIWGSVAETIGSLR